LGLYQVYVKALIMPKSEQFSFQGLRYGVPCCPMNVLTNEDARWFSPKRAFCL
jgi:hypothetical protein